MDFQHDNTSRLTATDELMLSTPNASPAKVKVSPNHKGKVRSGSIQVEDVAVETLKKIEMPKPFSL